MSSLLPALASRPTRTSRDLTSSSSVPAAETSSRPATRRSLEHRPETRADLGEVEPRAARIGESRCGAGRGPQLQQQVALLAAVTTGQVVQLLPAHPGTHPAAAAPPPDGADPEVQRAGGAAIPGRRLQIELEPERHLVGVPHRLGGSREPAEAALPLRPTELAAECRQSAGRDQDSGGVLAVHPDRARAPAAMHVQRHLPGPVDPDGELHARRVRGVVRPLHPARTRSGARRRAPGPSRDPPGRTPGRARTLPGRPWR